MIIYIESFADNFKDVDATVFDLALDFEADFDVVKTLIGQFNLGLAFEAEAEVAQNFEAEFDLELDLEANLFINNEPNVLLEAAFEFGLDLEAEFERVEEYLAVFEAAFDFEAELNVTEAESAELLLIVDIVPEGLVQSGRNRARFRIDGVEVPIESFSYSEPADRITVSLEVSLANIEDRARVTRFAEIQFEIGQYIDGNWEWFTLLDSGEIDQANYTLSRDRDRMTVTGVPAMKAKLNTTPERDLVIFDPLKQNFTAEDFPPIRDTDGNLYLTELVPVVNLKLYDLFQRVFVQRCGFASYQTNLPNFPISQASFEAGQPYLATMNAIIGMFSPDFKVVNNTLWIRDTTAAFPSGFPPPREVPLSNLVTIAIESDFERVNAIRIAYSADRRNYDYFTTREEVTVSEVGTFGEAGYQKTTTTRTIREYRRSSVPFVILDEEIREVVQVTEVESFTVAESLETFAYDAAGNLKRREKTVDRLLPDLTDNAIIRLIPASREVEEWKYKPHPFQPGRKYQSEHTVIESALITVETENPQLDEPYERDIMDSYRAGNVTRTMTVYFGTTRTLFEKQTPLRGGQVRLEAFETDNLARQVTVSESRTVAGDVSMNGLVKEQQRMLVFAAGDSERSTERIEDLNCGELPVEIAIPLARRVLRALQTKPDRIQGQTPGVDLTLEPGLPVTVTGRGGEDLGTFSIEGRTITGDRNAFQVDLTCKQI